MSLRQLARDIGYDCPAEVSPVSRDTTLAFAFDSGYLEPFKTFVFSMIVHQSYLDSPICIYTDDRRMLDDPMLASMVDNMVEIKGPRLEILQKLARQNVERPERSEWNKGTFLKWAVFEPQTTSRTIFLDADMLALKPLEAGFSEHSTGAFSCVPQFQRSLRVDKSGHKPAEELETGLHELIAGDYAGGHRSRVNSGVMSLSNEVCSTEFWDRIVGYADTRVELSEQSFFSSYFKTHDRSFLHLMPAVLNFQYAYSKRLPIQSQKELLDLVSILHFAGPAKPWEESSSADLNYGQALWLHYDFNRKRYLK